MSVTPDFIKLRVKDTDTHFLKQSAVSIQSVMPNCSACKKAVKASERIVCTQDACERLYHNACVNLSAETSKKIHFWTCPLCAIKQPRVGDNSNTPVKTNHITPGDENVTVRKPALVTAIPHNSDGDISNTYTALHKTMSDQFQHLCDKIGGLEESIKFMSSQYEDILKTFANTKADILSIRDENKSLREELQALQVRTKHLEDEQARQEQWARLQNIEVIGVPETKVECAVDVIVQVAAQAGVTVSRDDIEFAHRVQARRPVPGVGRPIVARFRQRATKDTVVAAARKHRNITSKMLGMGGESKNIYINEHLTKSNKQLLKICKTKALEINYKHVWTKNCRIYIRKTDTSPPIPILSMSDLGKII